VTADGDPLIFWRTGSIAPGMQSRKPGAFHGAQAYLVRTPTRV
jgi:hypothetical protein